MYWFADVDFEPTAARNLQVAGIETNLLKHGTNRQRRLPLAVTQLDVVLLLELAEQQVAALLERGGPQQGRHAVLTGRCHGRRLVEGIREAVVRAAATSGRRR